LNGNRIDVSSASGRAQSSGPSNQVNSNELFVTSLPADVRYQDVQSFFASSGEVQRVNVGPRGTYVRFRTTREAEGAMEKLNGVLF
jgi:RNA recognition motif-containing protein